MKNPFVFIVAFVVCASCQPSKQTPPLATVDSVETLQASPTETAPDPGDVPDTLPQSVAQHVPEGYSVGWKTFGNLNLDGIDDLVLVLFKNGEDSTSDVVDHPEKRPLLLFIGEGNQSYKLAARNDKTVYCIDCGGILGDPFTGVKVKNGYFSIEHYGGSNWRWTRIVTYKYNKDKNNWFLHRDGGDSFNILDPDKVETTVKTTADFGIVPFEQYDIFEREN